MIGGIGFTNCWREWQLALIELEHGVDLVVLDPHQDGGVALLQEAAGRVQPGGAELALEQGVDEVGGVLVVHDRGDELHARRSVRGRARLCRSRSSGCTIQTLGSQ